MTGKQIVLQFTDAFTLNLMGPGLEGGEEQPPPWESALSHSGPNFSAVSDIPTCITNKTFWELDQ